MSGDAGKRAAARAAADRIDRPMVLGVGTGSTVERFIEVLPDVRDRVQAAVATSSATARRLTALGIEVIPLHEVERIPLYVDGADEATRDGLLVKGGGGALTREKIVAEASERFVCIVDTSKVVAELGTFPLPLEVLSLARRHVADAIARMGGRARLREGFTTDNGHAILDVDDLPMPDPRSLELELDRIPGVVTNGLFCRRGADLLLVGGAGGVERIDCTGPAR